MRKNWRRCALLMLSVVLLAAGVRTAAAEEAADMCGAAVLEIASGCTAPGMDRPYAQGYVPSIADGEVRIVLPLQAVSQEEAPDVLNVAVSLGDVEAPFLLPNYDMPVKAVEVEGNDVPVYLIDVSLRLEQQAPAGRYPVMFTCSGEVDGLSFAQMFTVFVTIASEPPMQTAEPEPDPEGDPVPEAGGGGGGDAGTLQGASGGAPAAEPTAAPQPKLMVISAAAAPAPVSAGEHFSLTVVLKNTSSRVDACNVLLSAEDATADIYSLDGRSSAYFPVVKAGDTCTLTTEMVASVEAAPGAKQITLHAGYDGPQGTAYSQDETVAVPVVQPVRFAVDAPDVPASLEAGETLSLTVNVMNLGRAPIRNVTAQVEAPGVKAQSTLFLGNLESGTAGKGTLYAFIGPKSEAVGEARYGETNGALIVSCEDETGTPYTQEVPFSLDIGAPVIRSRPTEEPAQPEESVVSWQAALIAGGGIAATALLLWLHRRKAERAADESR